MKLSVKFIAQAAMIAAIYATLTLAISPLSYGGVIQFRISEALSILPIFTPAAIPGLVIGCFIANFGSPYGLIDVMGGTMATLIAVIVTRMLKDKNYKGIPILAPLPAVIFNAVIVGAVIVVAVEGGKPDFSQFTFAAYAGFAAAVGFGQLVVCYGLGLPLAIALKKSGLSKILTLK